MATKKLYDLVVKTGTYENNGETKNRYQNMGAVMEKEDGGRFIFIDRTFNPAGLPNPENRNNIIVSMFKKDGNGQGGQAPIPSDDDIPF